MNDKYIKNNITDVIKLSKFTEKIILSLDKSIKLKFDKKKRERLSKKLDNYLKYLSKYIKIGEVLNKINETRKENDKLDLSSNELICNLLEKEKLEQEKLEEAKKIAEEERILEEKKEKEKEKLITFEKDFNNLKSKYNNDGFDINIIKLLLQITNNISNLTIIDGAALDDKVFDFLKDLLKKRININVNELIDEMNGFNSNFNEKLQELVKEREKERLLLNKNTDNSEKTEEKVQAAELQKQEKLDKLKKCFQELENADDNDKLYEYLDIINNIEKYKLKDETFSKLLEDNLFAVCKKEEFCLEYEIQNGGGEPLCNENFFIIKQVLKRLSVDTALKDLKTIKNTFKSPDTIEETSSTFVIVVNGLIAKNIDKEEVIANLIRDIAKELSEFNVKFKTIIDKIEETIDKDEETIQYLISLDVCALFILSQFFFLNFFLSLFVCRMIVQYQVLMMVKKIQNQ